MNWFHLSNTDRNLLLTLRDTTENCFSIMFTFCHFIHVPTADKDIFQVFPRIPGQMHEARRADKALCEASQREGVGGLVRVRFS